MDVFPISILNFSKFPQDSHSVLIPGKLFIANSKVSDSESMAADKSLIMDYPVQLKDMAFSLVCTGGTATVRVNLGEYTLTKGTACIVIPESFFQIIDASEDFAGVAIAIVRNFFDYTSNVNMTMKELTKIVASPIAHI